MNKHLYISLANEYGLPQQTIFHHIIQRIFSTALDRIYAFFGVKTSLNKAKRQKALSDHKEAQL